MSLHPDQSIHLQRNPNKTQAEDTDTKDSIVQAQLRFCFSSLYNRVSGPYSEIVGGGGVTEKKSKTIIPPMDQTHKTVET